MAIASIPVDLLNPGQVFACIGFAEAAEILLGEAKAAFDWRKPRDVRFHLSTDGELDPFQATLAFLESADVHAIAPAGTTHTVEKGWPPIRYLNEEEPFPFPDPDSPATLPAVLAGKGPDGKPLHITIDYWGDETRDSVKFWGGSRGYTGAALARDALNLVRGKMQAAQDDPFALSAIQSSSYRLDWRRDYIPIDAGFSLNQHTNVSPVGYPLVEVLGAIGLSFARPKRINALEYRYAVIGAEEEPLYLCELNLLRAALCGTKLPFSTRRFSMSLGWPAQEGQARCITTVTEEANDD